MNRPLFVLLLTTLTHVIVSGQPSAKFEIAGSVTGFADSTVLYLEGFDSTLILYNRFYFAGALEEKVRYVLLRTADYSDYKLFWLENAPITLKAEKGKFRDAVIKGSKTQDEQSKLDAAIKATGNEKEQHILFVRNHPYSPISIKILRVYAAEWGKDITEMLYRDIAQELKNTDDGRKISEFISLNQSIQVGDRYADFSQQNTAGEIVRLSDIQGKLVLLEFWGSWCMPCREGHPELVNIYNEFKSDGFEILGVASDSDRNKWLEAVRKDGLPWQNVSDLRGDQNRAALVYGIYYYPTNYLIDSKGVIIAKDLRGAALRDTLLEILK